MAMQLSGSLNLTGSLNVSSSVNLSGSIIINQLTYPTADFADGQYGVEVPTLGVNNIFTMEIPKTIYEHVKNDSGVTLLKGTPVHSTGTVGFNTLVIAASASNASTMPATYILAQDLDDEEEGLGIAIGAIQGVNTTGLIAGDAVYVGANGGWTQTKPTGSNLIQNLGIVTKVGINGGGVVLGAGRSNDVPNIQEGYFWAGNSGSVATTFPTSSFELSGRGVVSSSNQLPQIDGLQAYTASLKGAAIVSSSQQITELTQIGPIEAYTASLKGAIEVSGQNVNVLGMITAQQFNVTYVSSSVMYQSGSTKFGDTSDDTHEFTGSKFEIYNSNSSGTMYAVVKNNRARNAAIKTTTINGSFIAGTSIGTDTFQYQIYDEVEGVNRVTINSQGGTTLQGAVTASQGMTVSGTNYAFKSGGGGSAHQTLVGQCTAAATTVAKKIAYVGYTHAIRVNIWADQDSSNGATAIADFTTMYGSSNGGLVYSSPYGNVSGITLAYNNGGSPSYTIDVTLTYTGAAPTINYSIVGISRDAMYTIA